MNNNSDNKETRDGLWELDFSTEKAKDSKKTALRLLRYLAEQKWDLLLVMLCILAGSAFTILSPKVLGMAINVIYEGVKNAVRDGTPLKTNFSSLGSIILTLLVLYLLESFFSFIQQNKMASVSQKLILRLRRELSEKVTKLPLRYFDHSKKGDILSRFTNDAERVADTLQESLTQLFTSAIGIIGAFVMMLMISPALTAISLAAIIVSMATAFVIAEKTERSYVENQEALGRLNGSIDEAFTGNIVVKAYGLEDSMIEENRRINEELYATGIRSSFLTYIVNPIVRLVNHLGYVVVAVRGAVQVMNGTISIGDIQAFIQYVNQVSEPVTEISYIFNSLQGALAAAERIFEMLDEEEEAPDPAVPVLPDYPMGNIRFEHIRFGYSDDKILMDDVSIDVKAGSKVAIVGPTGAGKTTLVNLLMRFYDLKGGRITLDGVDIVDMGRGELRSLTAMVLQESWLFGGTIKENIAYGHENAADDAVYAAAKAACADHFIRTMPQGYDTILSDEVNTLSQGQRQLLTIARAILADPLILILDEATSSVDTRTELEIQAAMDALMKGRTSFVIAHRLSTIRNADCILVMDNGSIIEQGSHEELMKKGGFYSELYNSQFAS